MGEVYLAEDTKLDRRVALKILPQEFTADKDRMGRFVREAKSASALNHPNIITIYEINETDGTHFIATEYIQGETLHNRFTQQPLDLKTTLDVAIQIVSGLDAAHRAGIIHRDIKPDNVMIRPDGLVKLLDFGIAKLSEKKVELIDEEAATAIKPQGTSPGMVIGTANYMSPEQAKGREVDARTDIFSFGIVLYEMLSSKRGFAGENALDVIGAILHKEPTPLKQVLPELPGEIERIVNKTLRKDADERYQTVRDLLTDLKDAKRELEFQDTLERTAAPNLEDPKTQLLNAPTTDAPRPLTSSAEFITQEVKKHKRGVALGMIVLLAVIGVSYWFLFLRSSNTKQIESIAVMPFVNESGNADAEYLSDGMTETLISSLSQLPNLNVKARSSVFRYKGKETNPQTIGKELNVQAILNGRVVQRGDQLTLSLELVDARTENVIWSEQYNRKQADLVTLQSEIASDVSSKLKSKLSGAEVAKVEKNYTANPEAYQLYLKGRFSWNKRTPESLKQAIGFYDQAIETDPNYALAFSGLAETYVLFSFYGVTPAKESMPKAKAAIDRALAIDDSLAEAHAARGKYLAFFEFDRSGSEREFRRAIELNPNYATAYQWLGLDFLVLTRRFDEGIRELRRAGELDPLSPVIGSDTAYALGYAGRFDEAIEQAGRTLELEPGFSHAHTCLGYALDGSGRFAEAISEYEKAISLSDDGFTRAVLIRALVRAGRRSEAERQMEALRTFASKSYVPSFCFAIAHTALGDKEVAIAMLEKDVEERSSYVVTIGIELSLNELRDDPRFKAMLKRMNLPE